MVILNISTHYYFTALIIECYLFDFLSLTTIIIIAAQIIPPTSKKSEIIRIPFFNN